MQRCPARWAKCRGEHDLLAFGGPEGGAVGAAGGDLFSHKTTLALQRDYANASQTPPKLSHARRRVGGTLPPGGVPRGAGQRPEAASRIRWIFSEWGALGGGGGGAPRATTPSPRCPRTRGPQGGGGSPALAPQGQGPEQGAERQRSERGVAGRQAVVPGGARTLPPGRRPVLARRPTSRIRRADPPLGGREMVSRRRTVLNRTRRRKHEQCWATSPPRAEASEARPGRCAGLGTADHRAPQRAPSHPAQSPTPQASRHAKCRR